MSKPRAYVLQMFSRYLRGNELNTRIAYFTDLAVFTRERVTEFWKSPRKYEFIARDIARLYLQIAFDKSEKAEGFFKRNKYAPEKRIIIQNAISTKPIRLEKSIPPLEKILENPPKISRVNGTFSMDLNPPVDEESGDNYQNYIKIAGKEKVLIDYVYCAGHKIGKRFFDWFFDLKNMQEVFDHMRFYHKDSPATLHRRAATLYRFTKMLYVEDLLSAKQFYDLELLDSGKLSRRTREASNFLTYPQISDFANSMLTTYPKNLQQAIRFRQGVEIIFLASTGVRVSEMVNVRLSDLDFNKKMVYFPKCKGNKDHIMGIPPLLEGLLNIYFPIRERFFPEHRNYLFPSRNGGAVTRRAVHMSMKRRAYEANVDSRICPRALRRSFAIGLYLDKRDMKVVQTALNHSDVSTTDRYVTPSKKFLEDEIIQSNPIKNIEPPKLLEKIASGEVKVIETKAA